MSHLHVTKRNQTGSCINAGPQLHTSSVSVQGVRRHAVPATKSVCVGLPISQHLDMQTRHMNISMATLAHGGSVQLHRPHACYSAHRKEAPRVGDMRRSQVLGACRTRYGLTNAGPAHTAHRQPLTSTEARVAAVYRHVARYDPFTLACCPQYHPSILRDYRKLTVPTDSRTTPPFLYPSSNTRIEVEAKVTSSTCLPRLRRHP